MTVTEQPFMKNAELKALMGDALPPSYYTEGNWKKFRKLPVVIDAALWDGGPILPRADSSRCVTRNDDNSLSIETKEGVMRAEVGDWIIRGVEGEVYPCKPEIFAKTYEAAE